MKVWLVIEESVCEGEIYTTHEAFDTEEKAKEFLQKRVSDVKISDHLYERYEQEQEDGKLYYYGNDYKEAMANNPVRITNVDVLRQYEKTYNCVIPEDEDGVVVEEDEYGFTMYLNGRYDEDHLEINIKEYEVK